MVDFHKALMRSQRLTYSQQIDELIAAEAAERKPIMFKNVKLRMTHIDSGVNCEFDLGEDSNATDAKAAIKHLVDNGFMRTTSATAGTKADNNGKTGVVTEVTKKADKNQWDVTITLDEVGAGQQKVVSFAATAFRKGDRVRLSRNDKGYYEAVIINDEGADGETAKKLPF